jgi:Skp family chaperone for outer membrane proteins
MRAMNERTMKMRAFEDHTRPAPAPNSIPGRDLSLELAKKSAELEKERNKALECLDMLERMRESLKREQARSAELTARAAAAEAKNKELSTLLGKISSAAATAAQASGASVNL